jgi:predicted DNA-binding ribbon-helix-helix protein
VRGLYERGFSAKDVRELFRLIDWMMALPPPLELVFQQDLANIQEEKQMPFITSIERIAHQRGLRKGIESVLRVRFGPDGLKLMPEIEGILDEHQLQEILTALESASSPDDVRRLWSAETR